MNNYYHAVEKLTDTLECLATHPGDVRERIFAAYSAFGHLTAEELPEKCRNDWDRIMKQIHKFDPLTDHKGEIYMGSVENTMKSVRKTTASKIAKKLYEIYWIVSENKQYN